ncbi:MAG TPA: NAD(P)H-dependent oxidoreductase [Saprospiraceae bacterium]|nr:NAD(P)H-dependent oxidoreductase [Saprospiraceae bacterium]HPN71715.1 NAD(P)H-dependent oxidoreductase [Saprospiraceae bacterium]
MKIIAFGASSSIHSINKKLATFTANLFKDAEVEVLDLNHYELPVFSVDREQEFVQSEGISSFISKLEKADLLVISMAEHNGNFTAAFKNLLDWTTRVKLKLFENKKMLLLSTSPGSRGGLSSLNLALERFPRHGAVILDHFSLPFFNENFDENSGIINQELKIILVEKVRKIESSIS